MGVRTKCMFDHIENNKLSAAKKDTAMQRSFGQYLWGDGFGTPAFSFDLKALAQKSRA
jgi:hypothetical protein